jgi:hypothetical protein
MGVVTQIHCLKTSKHAGRFGATVKPRGSRGMGSVKGRYAKRRRPSDAAFPKPTPLFAAD